MEVGRLDFEADNYGTELEQVMQCLATGQVFTERDIQSTTGLPTKSLNYALPKLEGLGYIKSKRLGASKYYLKVMHPSPQEWFTIDEAADQLRVSRRTVYQLVQKKQLTAYRVGRGGHRRFKLEDLNALMQREDDGELSVMSLEADPVLVELWDNKKDARYDTI